MNISEVLIAVVLLIVFETYILYYLVDAALGDACFSSSRVFLNVGKMDI